MCVATSTIVAAGISAAGSIAGAKMASGAAKDAAKTQVDASKQALGLQQQQYQQARQDFSPYQQAGVGAVGRLQQRAAAPPPQFNPGQPPQPMGPPQMGSLGLQQPSGGPMTAQGGPQGQMVTVQAPDGSTRPIPAHLVPMAIQRGGKVVG